MEFFTWLQATPIPPEISSKWSNWFIDIKNYRPYVSES